MITILASSRYADINTILFYIYKALHDHPYICEIVEFYMPKRSLRSSSQCMLDVPTIGTNEHVARLFSYIAAISWNAISDDGLKHSEHVDDFRKRLKTIFVSVPSRFSCLPLVLVRF